MSKGAIGLIAWLASLSAALILVVSVVVHALRVVPDYDLPKLMWMSLMRTLDAGTMGNDEGPWPFLLAMFIVTLGGVFVVSMLIGVLTTGIENKLEELRKGRSQVIERNHTVILGWSEHIFTIVSELVVANENRKNPSIVILADQDKVEMEDQIRARVGNLRNTRIVCRSGSPIEQSDLELVSLATCRSIIVLSEDHDDPDSNTIKTVLAITNSPTRRAEPYHIVAELHDPRNAEVARMVGRDELELVMGGEVTARIIAQTCHQAGLSVVYTDLMDFEGDEIYFQKEPALVGKTFGEALLAYEDSAVLGLCRRDEIPTLNPPMDTIIREGDAIIAISEDDDTVRPSGLSDVGVQEDAIQSVSPEPAKPTRTLILGWNWRAPMVINELANYVAPGSELMVVTDCSEAAAEVSRSCLVNRNQTVICEMGDTTDRRTLDALNIPGYHHVILLSCSDTLDPQRADARTLVTLLHLRDIADKSEHSFSIVSEMLDVRNRNLAEVTRADDFIVSDKLISLMLAQISENKQLNAVFTDLFAAEGSEIYLKPASAYVRLEVPVNFYTVVEAARRRGEVAFGYRQKAKVSDAASNYGVVINPDKSKPITFAAGDTIVVLAKE